MKTIIAERLKTIRVLTELSQQEFAAKIGFTPVVVNRIEKENRQPDIAFLAAIRKHFNVDLNALIAGEQEDMLDQRIPLLADDELQGTNERREKRIWIDFPEIKDISFAYQLKSESMAPEMRSGDVLLIKKVAARVGDRAIYRDAIGRIRVGQLGSRTETGDDFLVETSPYTETQLNEDIHVLGRVEKVLRKLDL
jgi:transcriptional regulator with XRE-family HTH domain